jgi:hypothetical protein
MLSTFRDDSVADVGLLNGGAGGISLGLHVRSSFSLEFGD